MNEYSVGYKTLHDYTAGAEAAAPAVPPAADAVKSFNSLAGALNENEAGPPAVDCGNDMMTSFSVSLWPRRQLFF